MGSLADTQPWGGELADRLGEKATRNRPQLDLQGTTWISHGAENSSDD